MTETMTGAGDASGGTAGTGPSSAAPAPESNVAPGASAGGGSVPAAGGDAQPTGGGEPGTDAQPATGPAAPPTEGEFSFAGRRFRDQKHAEDYVKAQLGILPGTQRKLAAMERMLDERDAELERMRRGSTAPRDGAQGAQPAAEPPQPKGWGQELLENGDLGLMAELAETKGVGHALYAMAELLGERSQSAIDRVVDQRVNERLSGIEKRQEFGEHMGNVMGAVRKLAPDYPELDEKTNNSPEAQQVRAGILEIWKSLPRDEALGDPENSLEYAVWKYRRLNGTPVFATPPGTDASPSTRVAAGAERAAGATDVLTDGTPSKPRPSGTPRTPAEELEDELGAADELTARGSSGIDLGVRRIVPAT